MVGPTEAEDLVQQAVLEFLEKKPKRTKPGSIQAWLERRMTRIAEDAAWDRQSRPETYSVEELST